MLPDLLEIPHQHERDSVGGCVEGTRGHDALEVLPVAVNLVTHPGDGGLDQREEVEAGQEQLGQVLLRVVAVVGDQFGRLHADGVHLRDGVLHGHHVRQVTRQLGVGNGLTGVDGIQREVLDCLQAVARLVETVACICLALRPCRDGGGVVGDGILLAQAPHPGGEEILHKALVTPDAGKQVMVNALGNPVLVWQRVAELPCQDAGERLATSGQEVAGKRDDLLGRACVRGSVDGRVYAGDLSDMAYDVHHPDTHA